MYKIKGRGKKCMNNSKNYVYMEHDKIQPFLEGYGLKVKEIKYNVWEILNPDHAVDVDEIQYEIGTTVAFIKPSSDREERDSEGYLIKYYGTYYIAVIPDDNYGASAFCWEQLDRRGLKGLINVCAVYIIHKAYEMKTVTQYYVYTVFNIEEAGKDNMRNLEHYVYMEHDKIQPFLESYGLKVKEVKHNIWEVLNPDHAVDVDEIQYEIGSTLAFTKKKCDREVQDANGFWTEYFGVYYIAVLPETNSDVSTFCWHKLKERGLKGNGKSVCSVYNPYGMRDENGDPVEYLYYL